MCESAVEIALSYAAYRWTAEPCHAFHGVDPDGVPVNTPDTGWTGKVLDCGWWKPGQTNVGIPYSWGNASSLQEFRDGLIAGKYAGNVPEDKGRRVSRHTIGVDCSGLLTHCWQLPRRISTREIPAYADVLEDVATLHPGDILAKPGSHAMIFVQFLDASHRGALIIDATRSTGKVSQRLVEIAPLLEKGYQAFRKKDPGQPAE